MKSQMKQLEASLLIENLEFWASDYSLWKELVNNISEKCVE